MSTAARKARKRARQAALAGGWSRLGVVSSSNGLDVKPGASVFVGSPGAALPTAAAIAGVEAGPFQHPAKVGTPVQDRVENQPAPQVVNRFGKVEFRRSSKAIARLRARGVEVSR